MLRRNIMCEDGLVNGAHGEIVGFKWSDGVDHQAQPGILPAAVLVKFHDPRVGRIHSLSQFYYNEFVINTGELSL